MPAQNLFRRLLLAAIVTLGAPAGLATQAVAQFSQQGPKLVGTGALANSDQGFSVALSADGNTAIVGGPNDNNGLNSTGAAWVYIRSAGVWSQQGNKLVGTGGVGNSLQGQSVALSADGNTAIVGGSGDNGNIGAVWVFTRSGGVWSQQGNKVIGTDGIGGATQQGFSVDLSADGNTAIVGGINADPSGAAWVFTRSGGVWTQQGNKLVGTGGAGKPALGQSVALSADRNTAIAGGPFDGGNIGAAWVFTRSAGVWSQQGGKLVGAGAVADRGVVDRVVHQREQTGYTLLTEDAVGMEAQSI